MWRPSGRWPGRRGPARRGEAEQAEIEDAKDEGEQGEAGDGEFDGGTGAARGDEAPRDKVQDAAAPRRRASWCVLHQEGRGALLVLAPPGLERIRFVLGSLNEAASICSEPPELLASTIPCPLPFALVPIVSAAPGW